MSSKLTQSQGKFLLKLARSTLESFVSETSEKALGDYNEVLDEERGVFVTLNTKDGNLRGCIGYSEPIKPLIEAVIDCTEYAASQDPRFPPVKPEELKDLKIEVTVLTKPELVQVHHPGQYTHYLAIGHDGIIVKQGTHTGLLLPQVAWECGWNEKQFLEHTCQKAGLDKDAYKDLEKTKVYKFHGQVFKENPKPNRFRPD